VPDVGEGYLIPANVVLGDDRKELDLALHKCLEWVIINELKSISIRTTDFFDPDAVEIELELGDNSYFGRISRSQEKLRGFFEFD
jgi:hypothetical protein